MSKAKTSCGSISPTRASNPRISASTTRFGCPRGRSKASRSSHPRFAFAGAEDARAQFHFVITRVERELERAAEDGDQSEAALTVSGTRVTSFGDLVDLLDTPVLDAMMAGAPVA